MQLTFEVNNGRRVLKTNGFKIYGSDIELRQIADAIQAALGKGLVQGWVGIGDHDKTTAFPNNGIPTLPSKQWDE